MQQLKKIRRKPNSAQVIVRFCVRLSILSAFAAFASVLLVRYLFFVSVVPLNMALTFTGGGPHK